MAHTRRPHPAPGLARDAQEQGALLEAFLVTTHHACRWPHHP